MPDIDSRFLQQYKDKGLQVVALNANGDPLAGVQEYLTHVKQTFPVGLEDPSTKTYAALTASYKGLNPYPVDVLVDKGGNVAYVAREYDPVALRTALEKLLAQ